MEREFSNRERRIRTSSQASRASSKTGSVASITKNELMKTESVTFHQNKEPADNEINVFHTVEPSNVNVNAGFDLDDFQEFTSFDQQQKQQQQDENKDTDATV